MIKKLKKMLPQAAPLVLIGALVISLGAASNEPAVELTVRARSMAFYVDGIREPNPQLLLPSGRRIRLAFVNEDRGVEHDLVLPDLGVASDRLPGDGARQVLKFRTPSRPSTSSYRCSLHPTMMTAALAIR